MKYTLLEEIIISRVKISVIKKFRPIDVFGYEIYSTSGKQITECRAFDEGQEFIVDRIEKMPEGFCSWAWRDIYKDVSVLYFNGNFSTEFHKEGSQHTSCSDGRKPVCFKLERISD